jgi:hypothetical protein
VEGPSPRKNKNNSYHPLKSESSKRGSDAEEARSDRPPMLLKVNRERHNSPPVDMADNEVKGNVIHDESGN